MIRKAQADSNCVTGKKHSSGTQDIGISGRPGTKYNMPLKGSLKISTAQIGEQGRKKRRWTL